MGEWHLGRSDTYSTLIELARCTLKPASSPRVSCNTAATGETEEDLVIGCIMCRTATRAICLHNETHASKRRRNAPVTEADQTVLLRELDPGPFASGARFIQLDQAAVAYALELRYAQTHVNSIADTVSCIDGMLEYAGINASRLGLSWQSIWLQMSAPIIWPLVRFRVAGHVNARGRNAERKQCQSHQRSFCVIAQ